MRRLQPGHFAFLDILKIPLVPRKCTKRVQSSEDEGGANSLILRFSKTKTAALLDRRLDHSLPLIRRTSEPLGAGCETGPQQPARPSQG
jgi:hypothetical protein